MLNIEGLTLFYQQQNVMRIKDYFFDQFLDALTGDKKPVEIKEMWYSTIGKGNEKKDYTHADLQQEERYSHVEIKISEPRILIKDRPHFREALILNVKTVKLINSIELSKGRWYEYPDKLVKEQYFKILLDEVQLFYNNITLSNVFPMKVGIKNLVDSPVADEIPYDEFDKAIHIDLVCDQLLKLMLKQSVYTFFLRCLDLNINFDDSKQHEYEFKNFFDLEKFEMNKQSFISMRLDVIIKKLCLSLYSDDNMFIADIFYDHAKIIFIDKGIKEVKITSNRFYVLEERHGACQDILISPIKSSNTVLTSELTSQKQGHFNHYDMMVVTSPDGDKSIIWTVEKVKVILKPYIIKKLLSFFMDAMPDYDFSVDKPNGYYKRNGELMSKDPNNKMTFILEFKNSLYLLTDDTRNEKVIVMETHLCFNFHRENYESCKDLLKKQVEKEYRLEKMKNSCISVEDFRPENDIHMPVGYITVNLLNTCLKVCDMKNIRKNNRRLMIPCTIFFSSTSILELLEESKFVINNEVNINIDKSYLKFSIKDAVMLSNALDYIMKDLNKFNDEANHVGEMRRPSLMVADINKDLEFTRDTKLSIGNQNKRLKTQVPEKMNNSRHISNHRKASEMNTGHKNTLNLGNGMQQMRRATEDVENLSQTE